MADTSYIVDIAFRVDDAALGRNFGALTSRSNDISGAWSRLGREVTGVGRAISDSFTGAVEKAGSMALSLGKIGIGAGFAAAAYGVAGLNNMLEQTQTSIAAVLNAQGQAGDMTVGMSKAGDIVSRMRKDAKELPGEFGDLLGIFQSGVGAAGNAGLNAIKFEGLAANAMAAGKALSVPLDQAGRELAMLLDGRAGAHNVFGTRLGIRADGFNQLGGEQRVKVITEALEKFQPAIRAFGTTFDAIWSTALDNVKMFGTQATAPLFTAVKGALGDFNRWFDQNQGTVSTWANRVGSSLADAFQAGRNFIEEWGPAVASFASQAYDRIQSIWKDIGPTVKSIADSIKDALSDGTALDRIENILKTYALIKAGGAVTPLLTSMAGMGEAAGGMGGFGGAAAGVLGAAGTVGLTIGAATLTVGVLNMLFDKGKKDDFFSNDTMLGQIGNAILHKSQSRIDEDEGRSMQLDRLAKTVGELDMSGQRYQSRMEGLIAGGDDLAASFVSAAAAANHAASVLGSLNGPSGPGGMSQDEFMDPVHRYMGAMNTSGMAAALAATAAKETAKLTPKSKGGAGGGSMRVEITINSHSSPGQIARAVVERLQQLRRHPNTSTRSPNFTTPRS